LTGPVRLPRRGGELLLRILEQSRPAIAASVLQDLPSGLPAELIKLGALERNGASRAALVPGDDDGPAFRDVAWQADRNSYGYFDAFDGNVVLAPESQMLYRAALPWWLAWLAASLKLTNSGLPTELVPASAWDIGDLWISRQRNVPVLFVRRLYRDVTSKALRDALHKRAGRSGGLILTSGRGSISQDSVERFVVVPIADVLTNDSQVFSIDRKLLLSPFMAAGTTAAPTQPIHLSPDGRRITINGTVTLNFKSDIHVKLIQRLVDGHKEGKRWRAQELLDDAGSSVTTLARAFGGKKWKQLGPYLTSKNGLWGFDL
jgi:hypothetical protein